MKQRGGWLNASSNLCVDSGRGRDIDLNMNKRDEADSGLEHFSGDPCVVFFLVGTSEVVSKSANRLTSVLCLRLAWPFVWTRECVSMLEWLCTVSVLLKIPGLFWTPLSTWSFASMISNFSALPILETRTRWRTRPCVLARALIGHANAVWKSGLRTSASDRNLTLMNRSAVALSASNVRSAQCTFSHSDPTLFADCHDVSIVVSSCASNAGKAAPATAAPTMSGSDCDTPTHRAPSPVPLGAPGGGEGK